MSSRAKIGDAHVAVDPRVAEFIVGFAQILYQHSGVLPEEKFKGRFAVFVIVSIIQGACFRGRLDFISSLIVAIGGGASKVVGNFEFGFGVRPVFTFEA